MKRRILLAGVLTLSAFTGLVSSASADDWGRRGRDWDYRDNRRWDDRRRDDCRYDDYRYRGRYDNRRYGRYDDWRYDNHRRRRNDNTDDIVKGAIIGAIVGAIIR